MWIPEVVHLGMAGMAHLGSPSCIWPVALLKTYPKGWLKLETLLQLATGPDPINHQLLPFPFGKGCQCWWTRVDPKCGSPWSISVHCDFPHFFPMIHKSVGPQGHKMAVHHFSSSPRAIFWVRYRKSIHFLVVDIER